MSHLNAFPSLILLATTYGISRDCPDMINLAMGLGIKDKQTSIWTQLQMDCCAATGVTCTSQMVIGIDWGDMRLNGSINGTALPTGLQFVYLYNNQITGNIPVSFPAGLLYLILRNNQLTGNVPESLPSGLQGLYLYNNQLIGNIPVSLPAGLQSLYLGGNQLMGNIPASLPAGLQSLVLDNNKLTGNIPESLPSGLRYLYLYNNLLTGNISLSLPTGLQSLGLNNNQLTGNIPLSLPTGLQYVGLNENLLTGNIPATLPAGLQSLDLDNNLLSGNIPATLPVWLQYLYLHNNQLTGDIPLSLPAWLDVLYLGSNQLTGIVKIGTPFYLEIQNNFITDVIIADTSSLSRCNVSNNPLLGNPHISNLTMCAQSGLYSASLLTTTSIAVSDVSTLLTALGTIDMHSVSSKVFQKYIDSTGKSTNNIDTSIRDLTGNHYSFRVILHTLTLVEIVTQFFKLLGSSLVLIIVIYKTPWKREFKSKMRKRNKSKENMLLSAWLVSK